MESFEEPGHISSENLLEVPTLSDSPSEDEDIKSTLQPRFSPSPRRRNSDSSEENEPETPSTIARKVSFADALGFDLVSVKEFDTWEVPTTLPNDELEEEAVPVEEFCLTPLFILPTTQEELLQKVRAEQVCLESVEFLPGITCMKGLIRVLNVSYEKLVYVRMSLDDWQTYYDILAEYVPNSCDGETDQFLFKISLVPPYQTDGAKVEFCIRYESSVGIFWANNHQHNYTLICHKMEKETVDNQLQEEVTDKYIKGCLKTTQSSKEEILAKADEDIWNNSRTSGIPEILYSHDDVNNEMKDYVKGKNVEHNDDNEDNEKELELLLSQHLTRTRDSSRDEKNLYTTEPVKFKNEPRVLGDELDGGLVRQPLPISSTSERVLQEQELHNIQMYSRGLDYSQLAPERFTVVDEVSSSGQSSECFSASENLVSQEYCSPTKGSVTAHTADVISSQEKINHTDILRAETHRPPTTERLFISEEDYDRHKENWERRLETVPFKDDETIQSKESVIEGPDDNPTLVHEHYEQDTSCLLTPESSWENITQNEPQPARYESKSQEYLRDELNASNLADAEVTKTSLQSSHIEDDIVEEKYTTEYNVDMGKEIELSILEQSPAEEPICPVTARPNNGHIKYVTEIQNQPLLSTSDSYEVSTIAELTQGQELMKFTVAGGKKEEELYEPIELSWLDDTGNSGKRNEEKGSTSSVAGELSQDLKIMGGIYPESSQSANLDFVMVTDERIATHSVSTDLEDDSRGNLEKGKHSQSYDPANRNILETEPCRSVPDSAITNDQRSRVGMGNQSWSGVESQLAASASEANERVQMKERTGGEAMWGIRDNTRCLNVTPMDELFTCQDSVRYEESSVAERDRTVEAKADTAANIIKMTSGSTAEKMSAAEKAVIVKLPQETALSDRPTEEKETVFDIHEGRNDSSHYPLCQCNTEGVLYDTKYEKESVSDIYNARIHETVPGEMMSVCHTSEKLASAEQNTQIDSPFGEMVWTFALERKAISEQDLDSEAKQCAQQQSLYEEEAGRGSRGIFPNGSAKAKNHVSSSDSKIVASESSSPSCPEGSAEVCTAERGKVSLPYIDSSVQSAAQARCDFSPTNEIAHVIPNISFAAELQELPQSSAVFPSNEKAERSIGQLAYQLELNQGTLTRPTILISEPTDEREATSCESEDLTSDRKILNLDTEGHDSQLVFDHAEISGQQTEAHSLSAECQVLKHIGYKILYFLLFVVFCVTLYHYDLFVCFALYLFSLYWLYCEGRQNKEAVKKD